MIDKMQELVQEWRSEALRLESQLATMRADAVRIAGEQAPLGLYEREVRERVRTLRKCALALSGKILNEKHRELRERTAALREQKS